MATSPHCSKPGAGRILLGGATVALLFLATAAGLEPGYGTDGAVARAQAFERAAAETAFARETYRPGGTARLVIRERPPTRLLTSARGYGWPVRPFDRQHPIRGFFGDPRIGGHGSRQFHFGVDISAPNGTAVYATMTGTVSFLHPDAISVAGAAGVAFEYWHLVPTVRPGQRVEAFRSVIGHVEKPWAHVHFSERRNGVYVNPLRSGALSPFADETVPTVDAIRIRRLGVSAELTADVRDETPLTVPAPWSDLPVMPAVVRWRVEGGSWTTAVDFRLHIPAASRFGVVFAGATRQNHANRPGTYRIVLATNVALAALGGRIVDVQVADRAGNASVGSLRIR